MIEPVRADHACVHELRSGITVVLRTDDGDVLRVRTLAGTDLDGSWQVSVLLPAVEQGTVRGTLEVPISTGLLEVPAELVCGLSGALLRAPVGDSPLMVTPPVPVQRRDDVRGVVRVPVRALLVSGAPGQGDQAKAGAEDVAEDIAEDVAEDGAVTGAGGARDAEPDPDGAACGEAEEIEFTADTGDVSGGGLALRIENPSRELVRAAVPGRHTHLELQLDSGPVACIAEIVGVRNSPRRIVLHTRFLQLSPADRERLISLVFRSQRVELARARGHGDGSSRFGFRRDSRR